MRGIYSMAALMALEEAGLTEAFDHVVGSSAGAINGAYLIAHQARLAVTVYLDDLSNGRFINFFRLRKKVDIDYLVDGVLTRQKALDLDQVRASRTTLHVILTNYQTAESVAITNRQENIDLMEALRATAALPILYHRLVSIEGTEYIDGGVSDTLPVDMTMQLGCKDVLVILTRQPSYRKSALRGFGRLIIGSLLGRYPAVTRAAILQENERFNRAMDLIKQPERWPSDVRIRYIFPSDMKRMVELTTSSRSKLLDCALMARNDMRRFLGLPPRDDNPWG